MAGDRFGHFFARRARKKNTVRCVTGCENVAFFQYRNRLGLYFYGTIRNNTTIEQE